MTDSKAVFDALRDKYRARPSAATREISPELAAVEDAAAELWLYTFFSEGIQTGIAILHEGLMAGNAERIAELEEKAKIEAEITAKA